MSTKIFYFSGTGNSLDVARGISDNIKDSELIAIKDVVNDQNIHIGSKAVGIVFPVYMWGPPLMVREFIEKADFGNAEYIFSISTFGGSQAGTHLEIDGLLKKKGANLSYSAGVKMPGNYIPMYSSPEGDNAQKIFSDADIRVKKISQDIVNRKTGIEKSIFLLNIVLTKFIYNMGKKKLKVSDKDFWVDNKCNGCGICEKICPSNNIKMINHKPSWNSNCEQCLACIHWCPKESIQYKKSTLNRKRYKNPKVSLDDFIR